MLRQRVQLVWSVLPCSHDQLLLPSVTLEQALLPENRPRRLRATTAHTHLPFIKCAPSRCLKTHAYFSADDKGYLPCSTIPSDFRIRNKSHAPLPSAIPTTSSSLREPNHPRNNDDTNDTTPPPLRFFFPQFILKGISRHRNLALSGDQDCSAALRSSPSAFNSWTYANRREQRHDERDDTPFGGHRVVGLHTGAAGSRR